MTTVRRQIMDAVATALGTATGLDVYRNLDHALEDQNLPALVVRSGPNKPTGGDIQVRENEAVVEIDILVARSNDPELAADPYEVQVHAALFTPVTWAGRDVGFSGGAGDWAFDLGDCCIRSLTYQFDYVTSVTSLEN